jgi:hypothetical protein
MTMMVMMFDDDRHQYIYDDDDDDDGDDDDRHQFIITQRSHTCLHWNHHWFLFNIYSALGINITF